MAIDRSFLILFRFWLMVRAPLSRRRVLALSLELPMQPDPNRIAQAAIFRRGNANQLLQQPLAQNQRHAGLDDAVGCSRAHGAHGEIVTVTQFSRNAPTPNILRPVNVLDERERFYEGATLERSQIDGFPWGRLWKDFAAGGSRPTHVPPVPSRRGNGMDRAVRQARDGEGRAVHRWRSTDER